MLLTLNISLVMIIGYLMGSFPTAYLVGKLIRGIDIREHGSGNVGATNTLRVLGTGWGILVLVIDIAKGYGAMLVAWKLFTFMGIVSPSFGLLMVALSAILGHVFTCFLNFKGGRGVATAAGVFLFLMPIQLLLALGVFIITVAITRYVSLGSIIAAISLFLFELWTNLINNFASWQFLIAVIAVVLFIIVKHKPNMQRLAEGTENQISFSKKK